MKTKTIAIFLAAVGASGSAFAAVSLDITKGPVTGGFNAGPLTDPHAEMGQWFEIGGPRPYEFYDNIPGDGGGSSGSDAIFGYATHVTYAQGGEITAFSIMATITNDLGTQTGDWLAGSNSHGESLSTTNHYVGPMLKTMLVTEFARSAPFNQQVPSIIAGNHDDLAWYCFNDDQGGYYVPAWDFGNIALGQSVTKQLDFTVDGAGLDLLDPRHLAIEGSAYQQIDLFLNRTTSLKISDWVDTVAFDLGEAYPIHPWVSSNVSVFHSIIPETTTTLPLALLLASGMFLRHRGRHRV